jgi:hypothetical protein
MEPIFVREPPPRFKGGPPPSRRHTYRRAGAHIDLPAHTQITTLVRLFFTCNKKVGALNLAIV